MDEEDEHERHKLARPVVVSSFTSVSEPARYDGSATNNTRDGFNYEYELERDAVDALGYRKDVDRYRAGRIAHVDEFTVLMRQFFGSAVEAKSLPGHWVMNSTDRVAGSIVKLYEPQIVDFLGYDPKKDAPITCCFDLCGLYNALALHGINNLHELPRPICKYKEDLLYALQPLRVNRLYDLLTDDRGRDEALSNDIKSRWLGRLE